MPQPVQVAVATYPEHDAGERRSRGDERELYDDVMRAIALVAETVELSTDARQAVALVGDKLVTAIAAAEVATMHPQREDRS